jgi:hypothetical protein
MLMLIAIFSQTDAPTAKKWWYDCFIYVLVEEITLSGNILY